MGSLTLADVIERIRADEALTSRRRDDLCSALRTMVRAMSLDPSALPADPRVLRQKLSQLSPAAAGVSARRWKNVRSLVSAALKRVGIKTMPGRYCAALIPEWRKLRAELTDLKLRHGLSRFIGHLSDRNIEPHRVTAAVFDAFRDALENNSLVRDPRTVYTTTCKLWNRAVDSVVGWPALKVDIPDFSRRYALPFSAFPTSFETDANDYLASLSRLDPFDEVAATPAKPLTIRQRRQQILELASALVLRGHSVDQITNLAALVDPPNAKEILRFFLERAGGKKTARIHHLACLLKTIGRRWVKVTEAQQDELRAICRRLAVAEDGMTPKNRARLRSFDDEANIRALVNLPERLVAQATRPGRGLRREALQVQFALAIAILVVDAPRIANLAGLNIDQHIIRTRPGAKGTIHLVIPGAETKTGEPQEFALPAWVARILGVYLNTYRPQLLRTASPWLFPNSDGGRRNNECFGRQIAAVIKKHTGLQMNVHLFRHLAVKLCHQANPGDTETPQRLLNHRTDRTTRKFYSELNAQAAHTRYDAVIDRLRELDPPTSKRKTRNGAGRRRDRH